MSLPRGTRGPDVPIATSPAATPEGGAPPLLVDALIAACLTLVALPPWWRDVVPAQVGIGTQTVIVLAFGGALVFRRRFPLASAAAVYAIAFTQLLFGVWLIVPGDALLLVALYSVTAFGPTWAAPTALVVTIVGSVFSGLGMVLSQGVPAYSGGIVALLLSALGLAAGALGLLRRSRGEARLFAGRTKDLTEKDAERVAQLAAAEERARIAREMHDVVAHSLSIVIAQADGGRYLGKNDPEAAITALTTIAETGRAALADMRRILGLLKPEEERAEMSPQPGADSIADLVASVRDTGLAVSFATMGAPRPLPPGIGLSLYRICQEALTNTMKHAGPGVSVSVAWTWLPGMVSLEVSDDGRGAAANHDVAGQGLLGMRQRAELFGGQLEAGPRQGGGFRVLVTMPTPPAPGYAPTGRADAEGGTTNSQEDQ